MTMTRRRFLSICALATGAVALGMREKPMRWSGFALGTEASIELAGGDPAHAKQALEAALDTVRRMESLFSIYDPQSAISRLNAYGTVEAEPEFLRLAKIASRAYELTGGLFDPTVQTLFAAKREGRIPDARDLARVGWQKVLIADDRVRFSLPGMAITFNGIAQGFATDRVSEVLRTYGYEATLVNIGEYRSGNTKAWIGVEQDNGRAGIVVPLEMAAIATSSANAYLFADKTSHILHPRNNNNACEWLTATVVHKSAAMADALSTALILSQGQSLAHKLCASEASKIILQGNDGQLIEI